MTGEWLGPYMDRMEEMSRHFFRHFHARIEAAGGLSPSQFFVLKVLRAEGPVTVGDLAQKMGMTTAGATGLVDRLVRQELVERSRDQRDRRVVWVKLSPGGAHHLEAAARLRRSVMAELMAPLTPDEVAEMVRLYEKIYQNMASLGPAPESVEKE